MKKSEALFGLLRIPVDMLAVLAALLLSYQLRVANVDLVPYVQLLEPAKTLPLLDVYIQTFVLPNTIVFFALAVLLRMYVLRATIGGWQEAGKVLLCSLLWVVYVISWYFLVRKQLFYSRILLIHSAFFLAIFVLMGRAAVLLFQRAMMRHGVGVNLVVSIGSHPVVAMAQHTLENDKRYQYLGHCTHLAQLQVLLEDQHVDMVLQTDPHPGSGETVQLIEYCRANHIGYGFLPPVLADVPHQLEVDRLGLMPLMRLQPTPLDGWGRVLKRLFDIVLSGTLIIVLSPVMLCVSIAILLRMGKPIFYVSRRVGEHASSTIPVLKFRSMIRDADAKKEDLLQQNERDDGPLFKITDDPRITSLGKFLRRFDLDELPQLFNILSGQMSLVGPRPHLPEEVERYKPYERRVFAVKPGLTGLSQVSGRSSLKFAEEVHFDLQYVEEWSLLLDLWILWRSFWVMLFSRGD